jgi:hypothetical protein
LIAKRGLFGYGGETGGGRRGTERVIKWSFEPKTQIPEIPYARLGYVPLNAK